MTFSPPVSPHADGHIGIIGIGLVGSELALRLLKGGKRVMGFDINSECLDRFVRSGGQAAAHAGAVFASCHRVLVSLPSHREVDAVFQQHAADLRPGLTIIDTTTGDPASTEAIATSLRDCGISYLDATVSGSSRQVREGGAILMVGGDEKDYNACRDLLDLLADASFHTGPNGTGAKMKLVTNLVLGLNRAVLAEGLAFAEALALSPELALKIMRHSPAYSRAMDVKGQKMIQADFSPEARLAQHLKDVRLILAAGLAGGLPMPLSKAHRDILEQAVADGLGELDNSAILQVLSARTPASRP